MRKITTIALTVAMIFSIIGIGIVGCGQTPEPTSTSTPTTTVTPTAIPTTTPTPTSTPTETPVIELRLSTQEIESSVLIEDILVPWATEIEEQSQGRVKITFYNNAVLAKAPEQYDAAVKGIADASLAMATYSPGRWPVSEIIQLPLLGLPTAEASSNLFGELYPVYLEDEYPDVHYLFAWCLPPTRLHVAPKPVLTLEDLEGLQIAITGATGVDALQALGAIPVNVSVPERYMSLERGLVDGQISITELVWIFKMYEITKYTTLINWGATPFLVVMNPDAWADLPADVQGIFDDVSSQWYGASGKILDGVEAHWVEELEGMGHEFDPISDEEVARWVEKVQPVHDAYIENLETEGLPGQEVYDYIKQFVESL